jgi:hypothetical protein
MGSSTIIPASQASDETRREKFKSRKTKKQQTLNRSL